MADDEVTADYHGVPWDANEQIATLRAEVARLLATLDAYREIVRQVAEVPNGQQHMAQGDWAVCPFACGASRVDYWQKPRLDHTPDCPVTRARKLLEPIP